MFNLWMDKRVRLMSEHVIDADELIADVQVAGLNVSYVTFSAVESCIDFILQNVRQKILNRPLLVRVVDAYGLRKADLFGKSDPFAVVHYENEEYGRTQVIQESLDPFWGATALQEVRRHEERSDEH